MGQITSLLKKVSELTVCGLRKTAIDLLSEYVENRSKNSTVYRTLGHLYLLDGNKEKSIECLRKASDESFTINKHQHIDNQYDLHTINEEDFDFIENSANANDNKNSPRYEYDEEKKPNPSNSSSNNTTKKSHILTLKAKSTEADNDKNEAATNLKITYKKRSNKFNNNISSNKKKKAIQLKSNNLGDTNFSQKKQLDLFSDMDTHQNNDENSVEEEKPNSPEETANTHDKKPTKIAHTRKKTVNENAITLDESNEDIDDWDEFDTLDENDDSNIDKFKKPSNDTFDDSDEDTFAWDEFDDLEEIAEEELRAKQEEVDTEGKLSPKQRAKQIATDFISETGWSIKHLEFLTGIFKTRGWSAIKRVLLKAFEQGMTPEELYLAFEIREIWKNSSQYWTTFSRIKSNVSGQQADASYSNLSWAEAFRIIRIFPSYPSSEELALFLDSEFDNWYNSASSRRAFKTFLRYLKYRTGSLHSALPRDIIYSFDSLTGYDNLFDNKRYEYLGSPEHKIINDYGIEAFENMPSRESIFDHINLYYDDDLLKKSTLAIINSSHKVR